MLIGRRSHSRAQLGEKEGDQQPDRDRDQHGDQRRDNCAIDRRQTAELVSHRIPLAGNQEARSPNLLIAGNEPMISDTMTPLSSSNTATAAARVRWRKTPRQCAGGPAPFRALPAQSRTRMPTLQSNVNHGTPPRRLHEAPLRMTAGALSHTRNRSARKSTRAAFGEAFSATESPLRRFARSQDMNLLAGRSTHPVRT